MQSLYYKYKGKKTNCEPWSGVDFELWFAVTANHYTGIRISLARITIVNYLDTPLFDIEIFVKSDWKWKRNVLLSTNSWQKQGRGRCFSVTLNGESPDTKNTSHSWKHVKDRFNIYYFNRITVTTEVVLFMKNWF